MTTVTERTRPAAPGLRASFREFRTFRTARWLAAMLLVFGVVRAFLGDWRVRDLVVAAVLVAFQPFTEWLIHVFILHWRPREMFGRHVDLKVGYLHRKHHADPRNPRYLFIAFKTIRGYAVLDVLLVLLAVLLRVPAIATGVTVATALTLTYEWTHWLIHSDYRPRSRLYRGVWRAHRLHHFRNENYWYGVTAHLGDRVLGTYPAKDAVPLSPTATTLGVDVAV